jgi:hypothetical protein
LTTDYCPACRGHGTNVHECEELRSAVVRASDLQHILDVYIDNGMVEAEDTEILNRLWKVLHPDA